MTGSQTVIALCLYLRIVYDLMRNSERLFKIRSVSIFSVSTFNLYQLYYLHIRFINFNHTFFFHFYSSLFIIVIYHHYHLIFLSSSSLIIKFIVVASVSGLNHYTHYWHRGPSSDGSLTSPPLSEKANGEE